MFYAQLIHFTNNADISPFILVEHINKLGLANKIQIIMYCSSDRIFNTGTELL